MESVNFLALDLLLSGWEQYTLYWGQASLLGATNRMDFYNPSGFLLMVASLPVLLNIPVNGMDSQKDRDA